MALFARRRPLVPNPELPVASPPADRRTFLALLSSGVTGAALLAAWPEMASAAEYAERAMAAPRRPRVTTFDAASSRDIEAAASQIIPSDGTPGAREAGVIHFIDKLVGGTAPELKAPLAGLVAALNGEAAKRFPGAGRFATLTGAQQHELMEWLDQSQPGHFGLIRGLTLTGMFCNPSYGGNQGKVGWKLLGFQDQFSWAPPFGYYDRDR